MEFLVICNLYKKLNDEHQRKTVAYKFSSNIINPNHFQRQLQYLKLAGEEILFMGQNDHKYYAKRQKYVFTTSHPIPTLTSMVGLPQTDLARPIYYVGLLCK